MQAYYAARAEEYDKVYEKPERQSDLRLIERWLAAVLSGKTVLEIACGTGYWTRFIATAASSVVAFDSAPETLRIASERVPAGGVRFEVGDAYALTAHRGGFDAAFAGFWFSHVPLERRHEFLRRREPGALEPGAKVVLLDNLFVEGKLLGHQRARRRRQHVSVAQTRRRLDPSGAQEFSRRSRTVRADRFRLGRVRHLHELAVLLGIRIPRAPARSRPVG